MYFSIASKISDKSAESRANLSSQIQAFHQAAASHETRRLLLVLLFGSIELRLDKNVTNQPRNTVSYKKKILSAATLFIDPTQIKNNINFCRLLTTLFARAHSYPSQLS